jgi:hypothetical protein
MRISELFLNLFINSIVAAKFIPLPIIRHLHTHSSIDFFNHRIVEVRRDYYAFRLHLLKVVVRTLNVGLFVERVFDQLSENIA